MLNKNIFSGACYCSCGQWNFTKMVRKQRVLFRGGAGFCASLSILVKANKIHLYSNMSIFLFQISTTLSTMSCGSFSSVSNIYMHIH